MPPVTPELLRRLGTMGLGMTVAAQFFVLYDPAPSGGPSFPFSDKVIHALIFLAPVAIALLLGFSQRVVPLLFALHAPVSELVQHWFLPHRTGDPWDVVADLVGVALGALLVRRVGRRREGGTR
ncbi:MAG: VanZ family protein [Dermatophilaceae bacterium]|uniref:VanZ-like domain-containing protein n=1 Tax=Phycicoccus elongatus Lp2 TaxID=1193181 RepID=N0E2N9_9MICO|nr:hypothetical protein [Phycicoccus elongatus]MCA0322356.1 VanZ family protein [Actinomycetota bacterium]CCH71203.1 hypothetical protein BN10_820039 [Phycicoccus elongatus Lp2]HOA66758.1 VanZ family protein [Phycicoccus elongatus]HPQ74695.1 VanZ family protein [Phycicoccus elongatus]HRC18784.1 VanZ family protein [Phycicoccus elongatus]